LGGPWWARGGLIQGTSFATRSNKAPSTVNLLLTQSHVNPGQELGVGPGNLGRILELGFNQEIDVAAFAGIVSTRTELAHLDRRIKTIAGGLGQNLALVGGQAHEKFIEVGAQLPSGCKLRRLISTVERL
jgi:hypothetical protein